MSRYKHQVPAAAPAPSPLSEDAERRADSIAQHRARAAGAPEDVPPGDFEVLRGTHVRVAGHGPDETFKVGSVLRAEGAEAQMMRASPDKFKEVTE